MVKEEDLNDMWEQVILNRSNRAKTEKEAKKKHIVGAMMDLAQLEA
jgi:hypothetical protein